ncbi:MAG: hypothetical protein Q9227_005425 [Pyrenula ochraceoflavens]
MASHDGSRAGSRDRGAARQADTSRQNSTSTAAERTESAASSETTPRNLRPPESRTTYGSINSFDTAFSNQPASSDRSPNLSVSASQGQSQPPATSTQVPPTPRKPPAIRRSSTQRTLPHRGQNFSVDDDAAEYEQDNAERAGTTPRAASFAPIKPPSTVRRRPTGPPSSLPRVDSQDEDEPPRPISRGAQQEVDIPIQPDEDDDDDDDDDDVSDAESFTLKDKQLAINQTHPFGIRIWKPAIYKKIRSVEKSADQDIHSSPSSSVSNWLWIFNFLWTLFFGWWLAIAALIGAVVCFAFALDSSSVEYGRVFSGLARYLFYPFGMFVRLEADENYAEEDEGEGRSISEYERWQTGDLEYGRLFFGPTERSIVGRRRNSMDSTSEHDSLLGRTGRGNRTETAYSRSKRRLFGRGQWTLGRVIFFIFFYFLVAPLLLLVSGICWFLVFWIPMGRVTMILFRHLTRRPLALSFHSDGDYRRSESPSSILLCTYRAVGTKYWKYTVDGTNIILINLLVIVGFTIFDYFVFYEALGIHSGIAHPGLLFTLGLFSVIPLAYFIGQAVASISAQSSMGMGAAVNAFFSTVVEVYLYCVALNEGKSRLVEGSIIGSIFAGILFLPGLSMCFGAIKRKTQRFNVKSAGVTSTMLLFAVIAAFGPTLFYQIYGSHELKCHACVDDPSPQDRDCRRCYFSQVPAVNDPFFLKAVRPFCWFAAVLLFLSYVIGLWFTLRTHAAVIWTTEVEEKKPMVTADVSPSDTRYHGTQANGTINNRTAIRESQLYKRILGQSLKQAGLPPLSTDNNFEQNPESPHVVPPKQFSSTEGNISPRSVTKIPGLSEEENQKLVRQVAEMAATAATVAARDATRPSRQPSNTHLNQSVQTNATTPTSRPVGLRAGTFIEETEQAQSHAAEGAHGGGHDAPNWSRTKSSIILLTATVAYAIIAEVLVNTVDVVLESIEIDEKFLGITLFALVPNTTEFLNAISFAMNGNIALSMEIGSAYALQVCLLQIPALVLYSAVSGSLHFVDPDELLRHTFNLIFPQWDMVTVILCVFLLSYMYGEGKSNYFKGSILVLAYLVVVIGFWLSGYEDADVQILRGVNRADTLALGLAGRRGGFGGGLRGVSAGEL